MRGPLRDCCPDTLTSMTSVPGSLVFFTAGGGRHFLRLFTTKITPLGVRVSGWLRTGAGSDSGFITGIREIFSGSDAAAVCWRHGMSDWTTGGPVG